MAQTQAQQVLNLTHPTAEITTLAAMRRSTEDAVYMAERLSVEDYTDPRRKVLFQSIVNLLRGVEPIDDRAILTECVQVARELKLDVKIDGGYLTNMDADPLRARAYANTVKRMAWLRGAGEYAYWLVQKLQEYPDPDALFTEAQERIQMLQPPAKTTDFIYGWDTVDGHRAELAQRIKDAASGIVNPFTWPWASWNKDVRPLGEGMIGVLGAPDGVGKSTYLELIAEHWAKMGMHTVLVHLEDAWKVKKERRLARWARVPLKDIEDGTLTPQHMERIDAALDAITAKLPTLHYYHAPGKSMTEIVQELGRRVSEGVCQSVVFDYLDKTQASKMQIKQYGDQTWERQANDIELLKIFAERNHLPVMTATQGNKSMQEGGIQTRKNISGSGAKTQKAQLVVILTRDIVGPEGLYDDDGVRIAEPEEYSPIVHVRIDKQNRGRAGITLNQVIVGQFFDVRDPKGRA